MLGSSKLCAVVAASDAWSMQKQLGKALKSTKTVELRLDWLASDNEIDRFLAWLKKSRPNAALLATCRRKEAGGRYHGSVAQQLVYLAEAVSASCSWYDLETETGTKCPPELVEALLGEAQQLASAHFFKKMPPDLQKVAGQLRRADPDAIKIAAHCDSYREAVKLLNFARTQKNIVAVPMGDVALPARILALRQNGALMYAPVEEATAPGQISLDQMKKIYRADRIDHRTRVYGVIGNPIGHSLSPVMQNAGFEAGSVNAIYLPFLVPDLKDFVDAIVPLGISGFSVTIPHKEQILKYLDDCDPLAKEIGAVNTVAVRRDGKLCGYNTDYIGVLRSLEKRIPLKDSRVLILGAGGAARAVSFALAKAGSEVCVYSRRLRPAKALAEAVGGEATRKERLRREFFDAIVNATPVGMHPHVNESPLESSELNCKLVFDTIYRPRQTKLLRLAERRGIETISGVDMFVAQGTAQWELWTGKKAPTEVMRRAVFRSFEQRRSSVARVKAKNGNIR